MSAAHATAATDLTREAAEFVDAVRRNLGDVELDELEEMLDDVRDHVREVSADTDRPLSEALGDPAAFATELRVTAGLGAPADDVPTTRTSLADRGRTLAASVGRQPPVAAVTGFLPELRPASWVARGFLLAVLAGHLTSSDTDDHVPLPALYDSRLLGLVVTAALVVASVQWGRARYADRRRHVAVVVATIAAGIGGALVLGELLDDDRTYVEYADITPVDQFGGHADGSALPANLYAALPDGTPIEQFLLYDENGIAVELPEYGYLEERGVDYEAFAATDERGVPVPNLYPRAVGVPAWWGPADATSPTLPAPVVGARSDSMAAPAAGSPDDDPALTTTSVEPAPSTTGVPSSTAETVPTIGPNGEGPTTTTSPEPTTAPASEGEPGVTPGSRPGAGG